MGGRAVQEGVGGARAPIPVTIGTDGAISVSPDDVEKSLRDVEVVETAGSVIGGAAGTGGAIVRTTRRHSCCDVYVNIIGGGLTPTCTLFAIAGSQRVPLSTASYTLTAGGAQQVLTARGIGADYFEATVVPNGGTNPIPQRIIVTIVAWGNEPAASGGGGGGGGVQAENAGTPITGGPFTTLNLLAGLSGADGGGGTLNITDTDTPVVTLAGDANGPSNANHVDTLSGPGAGAPVQAHVAVQMLGNFIGLGTIASQPTVGEIRFAQNAADPTVLLSTRQNGGANLPLLQSFTTPGAAGFMLGDQTLTPVPFGVAGANVMVLNGGTKATNGGIAFFLGPSSQFSYGAWQGIDGDFLAFGGNIVDAGSASTLLEKSALGFSFFNGVARDNNFCFGASVGTYGGGQGVINIHDATTIPTTNPTTSGILFSEAGELHWRSSGGIDTQLTPKTGGTGLVLGAYASRPVSVPGAGSQYAAPESPYVFTSDGTVWRPTLPGFVMGDEAAPANVSPFTNLNFQAGTTVAVGGGGVLLSAQNNGTSAHALQGQDEAFSFADGKVVRAYVDVFPNPNSNLLNEVGVYLRDSGTGFVKSAGFGFNFGSNSGFGPVGQHFSVLSWTNPSTFGTTDFDQDISGHLAHWVQIRCFLSSGNPTLAFEYSLDGVNYVTVQTFAVGTNVFDRCGFFVDCFSGLGGGPCNINVPSFKNA